MRRSQLLRYTVSLIVLGTITICWVVWLTSKPTVKKTFGDTYEDVKPPSLVSPNDRSDTGSILTIPFRGDHHQQKGSPEGNYSTITVLGESGDRLSGALVYTCGTGLRRVRRSKVTVLGKTDLLGEVCLSNSTLRQVRDFPVAIFLKGYHSVHIESYDISQNYVITLIRSKIWRMAFVDIHGVPVPDVWITLTRVQAGIVEFGEKDDVFLPGDMGSGGILTFSSDTSGQVELAGLHEGEYWVQLDHKTHTSISINARGRMAIPPDPDTVVMAAVYAVLVRTLDGDIGVGVVTPFPGHWRSSKRYPGNAGGYLESFKLRLRRRFPGCICIPFVPSKAFLEARSGTGPEVPILVGRLGEEHSKQMIPSYPIDLLQRPVVLKCNPNAEHSGQLKVLVIDSSLGPQSYIDTPFWISGTVNHNGKSVHTRGRTGVPLTLPAGKYKIESRDARLTGGLFKPTEAEVRPRELTTTEILSNKAMVEYRIRVSSMVTPGFRTARATIISGKNHSIIPFRSGQLRTIFLPERFQAQITITADGHKTLEDKIEVPAGGIAEVPGKLNYVLDLDVR